MLPKLGPLQQILNTRFKRKSDGMLVMAQFYAPRSSATGGVEDPYRVVRVGPKSVVRPGDVLIGATKKKYLLLRGGSEERDGIDGIIYKTIELDRQAEVFRTLSVSDPITKRTNTSLVSAGKMDYASTPTRQGEDSLRIQYDNYDILTDFKLLVGDSIDKNKIVQQAETRLGVVWARMRDV